MNLAVVSGGGPLRQGYRGPVPSGNLARGFVCQRSRRVRVRRAWMGSHPLHGARKLLESFWKQTFWMAQLAAY